MRPVYPSNNPPVLPGMFTRGMSEGYEYPVDDLRIGCGHRLEPPDMDYPCGQVVLARGSHVCYLVVNGICYCGI